MNSSFYFLHVFDKLVLITLHKRTEIESAKGKRRFSVSYSMSIWVVSADPDIDRLAPLCAGSVSGLLRLEELVRRFLISRETLSVRMLDDNLDPTPLLKEIRDDKVATIIIDANASVSYHILKKVGRLVTQKHRVSLIMWKSLDWNPFVKNRDHGEINIGYRFITMLSGHIAKQRQNNSTIYGIWTDQILCKTELFSTIAWATLTSTLELI